MVRKAELRKVPAVEKVLQALGAVDLPRPLLVSVVRAEVAALREGKSIPEFETVLANIREAIATLERSRIQPVINATGVVIHTNLGRSPLASEAVQAISAAAAHYNNLEYDLTTGERGGRAGYLEKALAEAAGAEAATVANNCAAALVLVLRHFTATKREVIISRGELVQIGGGFRIPEILEASGAKLKEVGTTNRTSLRDYERALGPETGLILKVHRSNFFMGGFVEAVSTEELAALAKKKRVPFVEDLGSGALLDTSQIPGLEHEPTSREILKRGVDVVCFSGDKLLGGPQAGILCGKRKHIAALKKEPFFRALRCDKLVLSALEATIDLYLRNQSAHLPLFEMLNVSCDVLRTRAEKISAALASEFEVRVEENKAQVGGGTLPQSTIPSIALAIRPPIAPAEFAARLRLGKPPVIATVSGGAVKLDLRTVFPAQDGPLIAAIRAAFGELQPEIKSS